MAGETFRASDVPVGRRRSDLRANVIMAASNRRPIPTASASTSRRSGELPSWNLVNASNANGDRSARPTMGWKTDEKALAWMIASSSWRTSSACWRVASAGPISATVRAPNSARADIHCPSRSAPSGWRLPTARSPSSAVPRRSGTSRSRPQAGRVQGQAVAAVGGAGNPALHPGPFSACSRR